MGGTIGCAEKEDIVYVIINCEPIGNYERKNQ